MSLKGLIYDLDGVITDTAKYQYNSWKWVGEQLGYNLTEKQNLKLREVGQKESLDKILNWSVSRISEAEKHRFIAEKNKIYLSLIDEMTPKEIFEGFREFNVLAKEAGIKVAIGSSSKNTIRIIDKLDMVLDFHAVVDGGMVENTKPAPDIFLLAAEKLQLDPSECLVIEGSEAGLQAAKAANMLAVSFGSDKGLSPSEMHVKSWSDANLDKFNSLF